MVMGPAWEIPLSRVCIYIIVIINKIVIFLLEGTGCHDVIWVVWILLRVVGVSVRLRSDIARKRY